MNLLQGLVVMLREQKEEKDLVMLVSFRFLAALLDLLEGRILVG